MNEVITKNEETVLKKLLFSNNSANILNDVEIAYKGLNGESLAAHILCFIKNLFNNKNKEAFQELKEIEKKWRNEQLTICCHIIHDCYKFNHNNLRKSLDEAKELVVSLDLHAIEESLEYSFQKYSVALSQWVEFANRDIRSFDVAPFWINFTETAFVYDEKYQEERAKIAARMKAEEEKRKAEEAKIAEEKRIAEQKRKKAQKEKELEESRQKQMEEERLNNLKFLEMQGIKIGSFKDSRDGHEYKIATIGKQTWMAEPLFYSEKTGVCSIGEGVDIEVDNNCDWPYYKYNWYAAKKKKNYKDSGIGKLIAFFIVMLVIFSGVFGVLGLLVQSYCYDSKTGMLIYWGIAVIPIVFAFIYYKSEDEVEPLWIASFWGVYLGLVFFMEENWFWIIWMGGFGTISIIQSYKMTKNYKNGIRAFFDNKTIAPEGYRMPTKGDKEKLKSFVETQFPNKKTEIAVALKNVLPNNFLFKKSWNGGVYWPDIYWVEGDLRWTKNKFKPFIGIKK